MTPLLAFYISDDALVILGICVLLGGPYIAETFYRRGRKAGVDAAEQARHEREQFMLREGYDPRPRYLKLDHIPTEVEIKQQSHEPPT